MGKLHILAKFIGKGAAVAQAQLPLLLDEHEQLLLHYEAKHLGSFYNFTGSAKHEVDRRVAESRKAWRSMGGV
eukprot:8507187-Heterocapsa_arctica.AAC.1